VTTPPQVGNAFDALRNALEARAPGAWELYRKSADSRELGAAPALRRHSARREEGWAARWSESGSLRFAAATGPDQLRLALDQAAAVPSAPEEPPDWPGQPAKAPPDAVSMAAPADGSSPAEPPELFDALTNALSSASRGEARLVGLTVRRGRIEERIGNAAGLDVAQAQTFMDGLATASARRGARAHESRLFFRWDSSSTSSSPSSSTSPSQPDVDALARRLADAATLPLSDRPTPFASGQWLLDPGVAAALLAALAPAFRARRPPRLAGSGPASIPVRIVDDATGDAPFDGEGVPTRRVVLFDGGEWTGRLEDLRSAKRSGRRPTGHGVRPSFRTPPRAAPRRLFFEASDPSPAAALLARVKRGLFASAVTAPVRVDLEHDRYEIEFTGISVVGGRAQGEVGGARAAGRVSELLRRIAGVGEDPAFFPLPYLVGSPTILIERASFE
jgi:predicted Zn-dependent protease